MIVETRQSSFEEPAENWRVDASVFRGGGTVTARSSTPETWIEEYDTDSHQTLDDSDGSTWPFSFQAERFMRQLGRKCWVHMVVVTSFALLGVVIWHHTSPNPAGRNIPGPLGEQQPSPSLVPVESSRPSLRPGDRDPWVSEESRVPSVAPNDDHAKACLAVLGIADSDRDGFISMHEYPQLVSLMSGGAVDSTDYDSLPKDLITNFETLQGSHPGGIPIGDVGTLLLEGAEESETAQLERVCDATLSTINELKLPDAEGGTENSTVLSILEGPSKSPTTATPSDFLAVDSPTSEPVKGVDDGSCRNLLKNSDKDSDGALSTMEFLSVVNHLSADKFVGTTFDDLPDALIAEYETLARHGGESGIPIHTVVARDNASICEVIMVAIDTEDAFDPAPPTSNGIPYPCCDWGEGYCKYPDNRWCHASEERCLGTCEGSKYHKGKEEEQTNSNTLYSNGVPLPCCSWPDGSGQCSLPNRHWCHGSRGACLSNCNGVAWITEVPPDEGSATEESDHVELSNGIPMPCCSWRNATGHCSLPLNTHCHASEDRCLNECAGEAWLEAPADVGLTASDTDTPFYSITAVPEKEETATANPTAAPTRSSTVAVEVEAYAPPPILVSDKGFTAYASFLMLDHLTLKVRDDDDDNDNPKYTLLSSGETIEGDGHVISEGQGYALLISGIVLASWDTHGTGVPADRDNVARSFHGYFNAWRDMCEQSTGQCQNVEEHYCGSEDKRSVCLPGWKHDRMATREEASGSAPDGDEDAIVGMILAVRAFANQDPKPVWYDTVRDWAERSCTSFLKYTTTVKEGHRLLKLGSCWGGWAPNGNNPSYHGTGSFKVMRNYQRSFEGRKYELPSFGTHSAGTLSQNWDSLIGTSYAVLDTVQCPDQGMVPNWVTLSPDNGNVADAGMAFSGSGTPQYEFGFEGGRTIWRIAMDASMFPEDQWDQPRNALLEPLIKQLADHYDPNFYRLFDPEAFTSCSADGFNNITSFQDGWRENTFVYGPLVSSLVVEFPPMADRQQEILDAVATHLKETVVSDHYYPRCWTALTSLMLNGAVASAGKTLS